MIHRGVEDEDLEGQIDYLISQQSVSGDAWRSALGQAHDLTGDDAVGLEIGALTRCASGIFTE